MKILKTRLKRFFVVLLATLLTLNPYICNFFGYADVDNRIFINGIKVDDTFNESERVRIVTKYESEETLKVHFGDKTENIKSNEINRASQVYDTIEVEDDGETVETFTCENNTFGESLNDIIAFYCNDGLYILKEGDNYSYKAYRVCDSSSFYSSDETVCVTKDFYNDINNATFEFYVSKEELLRTNFNYGNEMFDITFPEFEKDDSVTASWKCTNVVKNDLDEISELYFEPVTNGYINNFYEYESDKKNDYVLTKTYISSSENSSVYTGNDKGFYKFDKWQAKQTGDKFTNFYASYKAPINITKQPQDATVNVESTATFSVDSDAIDGIYNWYTVNGILKEIDVYKYGFILKDDTYMSNIEGKDNTTAYMSFSIDIVEKTDLKIDYSIDSEENYDYGYITVTGPNNFKETVKVSGKYNQTAIFKLLKQGKYDVDISYEKDTSQGNGLDRFEITKMFLNDEEFMFENEKLSVHAQSYVRIGSGKELKIVNVSERNDGTKYKCMVSSPSTDYIAVSDIANLHVKQSPVANFYIVDTNDLNATQFASKTYIGTGKVRSISNTLQGEQSVKNNIISAPTVEVPAKKDLVFFYSVLNDNTYEVYGTYVDAYTTSYKVEYNGPVVKVGNYPEKTDFIVSKLTTLRDGQITKESITNFDILNKVEKVGDNVINISVDGEKLSTTVVGGDVPSGFEKEVKNSSQDSATFSYKVNNLNNGTNLKVSVYVDGKFYKDFSENNKEITLINLKSNKEYNVTINFENNFGKAKDALEFKVKTLPEVKSLRAVYDGSEYVDNKLDKTKVKVYAVFEDDTEKELDINDITFDQNTLIEKEGNNNFNIKYGNIDGTLVVNGIGIKQINGTYDNDAYIYETLNKDNFKFEIVYKDGFKKDFKYDSFTKKPESLYVKNIKEQIFDFEYKGISVSVTINPIAYDYITATYPSNKEKVGTKFDDSKVTVTLYYNKDSKGKIKSEIVKNFAIKGNEIIAEGKNEYEITFEGLKTILNIEGYKEAAPVANNNSNNNTQATVNTQVTPAVTTPSPVPVNAPTQAEQPVRVQTSDDNNILLYALISLSLITLSGVTILKLKKKH